jgi:hypothetical protein
MSEQAMQDLQYTVSAYEPEGEDGALVFTFVPRGPREARGRGAVPEPVPQFIVSVRQEPGGPAFDWSGTRDDPGPARGEIEAEVADRMRDRAVWIHRVTSLVRKVEQWAHEMGWSTRRVEKKLDDAWIGKHQVPALLMQEDTCRIMLEPVGRSTPGAEGVVELYLMPAYDDIASLYYYGDRWNLHYMVPGTAPAATVREAPAVPLKRETLEKVLVEMRQHAA